eukprot:3967599-Heterocapsa_arctica.AAC.1
MEEASINRSIEGSRYSEDFYRVLKSNRHNGGGCCRTERTEWRRQIAENNFIVASKNVIPTTDMEMKIK